MTTTHINDNLIEIGKIEMAYAIYVNADMLPFDFGAFVQEHSIRPIADTAGTFGLVVRAGLNQYEVTDYATQFIGLWRDALLVA